MAVGLVVDYMVHIVHFFLHQASNTDHRFEGENVLVCYHHP